MFSGLLLSSSSFTGAGFIHRVNPTVILQIPVRSPQTTSGVKKNTTCRRRVRLPLNARGLGTFADFVGLAACFHHLNLDLGRVRFLPMGRGGFMNMTLTFFGPSMRTVTCQDGGGQSECGIVVFCDFSHAYPAPKFEVVIDFKVWIYLPEFQRAG